MSETPFHQPPASDKTLFCSFCGKGNDVVRTLVTGQTPTAICNECAVDVVTVVSAYSIDNAKDMLKSVYTGIVAAENWPMTAQDQRLLPGLTNRLRGIMLMIDPDFNKPAGRPD